MPVARPRGEQAVRGPLGGQQHGLGAVAGVDLAQHGRFVVADRFIRQIKLSRDAGVAQTAGDEVEYLGFARAELREWPS
jgi:hypothetical protein